MEITGKVISINAKKGVSQKTLEEYVTRDVLVEYKQGDYTRRIVMSVYSTAAKPRWTSMNCEEGKTYTFRFDIDAHEYNGRWFNSVNMFSATPAQEAPTTPQPVQQQSPIPSQAIMDFQEKFHNTTVPVTSNEQGEKLPF